jgi:ArsR family transcriptional regulator
MNQSIQIFKLLSDESRLRVINLIHKEKLCVCQLSGITGIAQPKVSKALSKLRDLNLVSDERQDKFVYYELKQDHELLNVILDHLENNEVLDTDISRLELKESFISNCSSPVSLT